MAEILHVDQGSKSATVQPGITVKDLLSGLRAHGLTLGCMPQVPVDTTLEQVIASDALCVEGRKAKFADKGRVEMIKFFTGDGRTVHGKGPIDTS